MANSSNKQKINANAHLIKGVVCGYRIEEIEDKFDVYKQCRRMEKLIDELAKEKNGKDFKAIRLNILVKVMMR